MSRCILPGDPRCQYDYADDTGESCSVKGCGHHPSTECVRCADTGWVCEEHTDLPWESSDDIPNRCPCAAPGVPCPDCNTDNPPRDVPGTTVIFDKNGDHRH